MKIAICSSASFYNKVLEIEKKLQELGFLIELPTGAIRLKEERGFDPEAQKSSYIEDENWQLKADLIKAHFKKIEESDTVLVVNFEKRGIQGYIGGNTLMEMAIAFHYEKPIYILNSVSKELSYYEEIMGMQPIFLNSDLSKIK